MCIKCFTTAIFASATMIYSVTYSERIPIWYNKLIQILLVKSIWQLQILNLIL